LCLLAEGPTARDKDEDKEDDEEFMHRRYVTQKGKKMSIEIPEYPEAPGHSVAIPSPFV